MSHETPGIEPDRPQWTGFWCMIVQQTQNAFNDKMAQFILIPLGGAVGFAFHLPAFLCGWLHISYDSVEMPAESAAGILISLPYVLFAPIAGWLSDRFSKRDVMLGSAVAQLLVLGSICTSVALHNMPLALCGFFALAMQAAFFSPAKIGINKELVGSGHIGFTTGIQQMTGMLAMLAGQIVAGMIFDRRYLHLGGKSDVAWHSALTPLLILTAISVPTIVLAWTIPRVPAHGGGKFTRKLAVSHFTNLADLWRDAPLRRASFGVAFFWGFAAFLNLWSVKVAKFMTGGGQGFGTLSSLFMASASLGMAAGFGSASFLHRKRIELGWVPVSGVAMTLLSLAIVFIPPSGTVFLVAIGLLAFSSALFLAPLNAWMQDHYPSAKRGELQSAVNLQDCLAGIIAVAVIISFEYGARKLHIHHLTAFRGMMVFISAACLLATGLIIRLLPAEFIRVIGVALVRTVYRVRVVNPDRLPKNGGVLLLPNHMTYADAFFISAGCPRPVRFVMDEVFMARRSIRVFTSIFDTMTIRRDQPLEAIREIIKALKNGDVVCLFPEGQISRTGTLCVLQRGFELIAKKAGHLLIPLWCDGSWGSVFSYERNRFFRKIPRLNINRITLAFGEAINPADAHLETVRDGLLTASSEAISRIYSGRIWSTRMPSGKNPATAAFRILDETSRRRMWINGYQIGAVNALQRHRPFLALKHDPLLTELPGLFAAFPALHRAELRLRDVFDGETEGTWVGGDFLRNCIQTSQITAKLTFYDFSSKVLKPVERAGVCHCPCLAVMGTVVTMSMPHPAASDDNFERQHGHKPRSWGKPLPGWHFTTRPADGIIHAHGPAAPTGGLPLPAGSHFDEEGFLLAREESRR